MNQSTLVFGIVKVPLVVCCGVGVDSVAILVGYYKRGIRPDLVIFADVGAERQATYDYIKILNAWLRAAWGMELTIVQYKAKDFKHWPHYHTIEENILTNISLPAIAYGGHSCSKKWKIDPQNKWLNQWQPAIDCWAAGGKVKKAIGFEDSPHERGRTKRCSTFAVQADEKEKYDLIFPLQEWGWDRERCKKEIAESGLVTVPSKSSCYFCTAMKPWEVNELPEDKLKRIVIIEARTAKRHLDYAENRAKEKGVPWNGKPLTEGIWRKRVKGMRGSIAKPGSITEYIREKGLLPSLEVDRLIAATPTHHLFQKDITNWQDWLQEICYPSVKK